jgi:hypothetical protein
MVILGGDLGSNFFANFLELGTDFPNEDTDSDFDAALDGPLMETRFVVGSSCIGEAGLFFPPIFPVGGGGATTAILLAEVGSEGRFETLPPLIFSANNFLRIQKNVVIRMVID